MKFLDQAKIYLRSGAGGAGSMSFRREKFIEYGGPDGGNGGKGGDIIFETVDGLNTLIDFRYRQHFKAPIGMHGAGRDRTGPAGEDLIISVPRGTQIFDENNEILLLDLDQSGQRVTFLQGGSGGFGNAHYKTATNRSPRRTTPGWPCEERWVWLRLKLLADVGLMGMPNAGKSTFLSVTSRAKPKIADYPFTTLHPNLGVVKIYDSEFVFADIPGLIEGAHQGRGLGTRFLGHIERTSVLLHLMDIHEEDIVKNYKIIRHEIESYGNKLGEKAEIIALNKSDLLSDEECAAKVKALQKHTKSKIFLITTIRPDTLTELLKEIKTVVDFFKKSNNETSNDSNNSLDTEE